MDISEILFHLGEDRSEYYNAVSPAIMQSSMFHFNSVNDMRSKLQHELEHPFYTRGYNPTVAQLRKKLAALEGAEDALVFSSGSAAVAAAVMSIAKNGDHIVCVTKPYSWTTKLLSHYLNSYGVEVSYIDGTVANNYAIATKENTVLYYLESPNSLTFELQDIAAVAQIAKSKGIATIIDNSAATPLYQQPIAMGIDLVVHSGTKYFNGHSDVVCGVVCGSHERIKTMMAKEYMTLGAIMSPIEAWMVMRGLRTWELRVEKSAENAAKVVAFLENHAGIEKLNYPFSKHHPQQELARKQMKNCSGLFSIYLNAKSIAQAEVFTDSLKHFLIAASWGSYESLVFPVSALWGSQNYTNPDLPWNMVRLYIGIESVDWLIDDLDQALNKMLAYSE